MTRGLPNPSNPLLTQVLERAGLPRVICRISVQRAIRRAGVDPATLDRDGLRQSLPALKTVLRVYLTDDQARANYAAIVALTEEAP